MATVNFMFTASATTQEDAEVKMAKMLGTLAGLCEMNNIDLQAGRFINAGRVIQWDDGEWEARYDLEIVKRPGITYNQIYALVNSVQACHYTIKR